MSTWGQYYHAIASQMALYRESNRRLAELADLKPGMTVVDLGCGSGLTSLAALEQVPEGLQLILIDSSPSMIEEARRNLGDRVQAYYVADAAAVADATEAGGAGGAVIPAKVDRVLCNMSLLSFRNPEAVLARWRRLIKPTGRLCFSLSGTYFNVGSEVVSPQYAFIQALHQRGDLARGLPAVDRLPNQRSIESTLNSKGFKPFAFEVQEIPSASPETEPGGELHNLMRLTPALPGRDHQAGVEQTLAALTELSDEVGAQGPRWRVAHFMAQPSLSPEELMMSRFSKRPPGGIEGEGSR